MEYQKIASLLENETKEPCKFRTRNWVEINDESRGTYTSNDIKFKTTMLRSTLCDYADANILVKRTITTTGAGNDDERNKPFTKCISRINNKDIAKAQDIEIVMPMHKLIKYSDNYSKTSGILWQYYKDNLNNIKTQSESFKSKIKITGKTSAAGNTEDVEIFAPLKYLRNIWRILEMPLINCEVNLILAWSPTCVISSATGETKFKITETKLYVPVVTLSTLDNAKLLQQLKSDFKRAINWNKYESNIKTFAQNRYLNHLINPSFKE